MDIEQIAVSEIVGRISMTDYLKANINSSDTKMSWDGDVEIYNDKSKKKSSFSGKVLVQVKGKITDDQRKRVTTFPISIEDIRNYLIGGGALFIVIYVSRDGFSKKLYYVDMLPVKIRSILCDLRISQKTKNVHLNEFPTDKDEIVHLFRTFYTNQIKQASYTYENPVSFDTLKGKDLIKGISFYYSGYKTSVENVFSSLFNDEFYLYAKIDNLPIEQPIDIASSDIVIKEKKIKIICVNGKVYYEEYSVTRSKDENIIKIGASLTIYMKNENQSKVNINFQTVGTLKNRIHDLKFFLHVISARTMEINSVPLFLNLDTIDAGKVEELRQLLLKYQSIQNTLDALRVTKDLDINNITDEEAKNLYSLKSAIVDKKPIKGLTKDSIPVFKVKISNITVLMSVTKYDSVEQLYTIDNFFKTEIPLFYEDNNGQSCPASQFFLLKKEHFLEISNIDYEVICCSICSIDGNEQYNELARITMLGMISAYDEDDGKSRNLLQAAESIAKWLLDKEMSFNREINELNYLQIIRRQRDLTMNEIEKICNIIESVVTNDEILFGAYLLLDNKNAALMHFEKLEPDIQKSYKSYPIYKFMK